MLHLVSWCMFSYAEPCAPKLVGWLYLPSGMLPHVFAHGFTAQAGLPQSFNHDFKDVGHSRHYYTVLYPIVSYYSIYVISCHIKLCFIISQVFHDPESLMLLAQKPETVETDEAQAGAQATTEIAASLECSPGSPKSTMAFRAILGGFGPLFYILLEFR